MQHTHLHITYALTKCRSSKFTLPYKSPKNYSWFSKKYFIETFSFVETTNYIKLFFNLYANTLKFS